MNYIFLMLLPCIAFAFLATTPEELKRDVTLENQERSVSDDCKREEFDTKEIVLLNESRIFHKNRNITLSYTDYLATGDKVSVCILMSGSNHSITDCQNKFVYQEDEYQVLPNKSVLLYGEIIEPGQYKLDGSLLLVCASDYGDEGDRNDPSDLTLGREMIYIGQIGSGISIVALTMLLLTFCFVPSLRNLPGYNLASLSVAFLFAYSFVLIGQIPEVLGLFCVISGILQQNFFLSAFFCMNILAFDVWRTLKLATEKLLVGTSNVRKKQFLWYSLYAWGCPMLITATSAILDNIEGVPNKLKPFFGRDDTCWMTNYFAKMVFFALPAFTLFLTNGVFFVRSFLMITNNVMKCTSDQKRTVRLNYTLYLRLAVMMGLTWLVGIVALVSGNDIVWFVHDVLNSLQGLFLFLLFACSSKVRKYIKGKASAHVLSSSATEKVFSSVHSKQDSFK